MKKIGLHVNGILRELVVNADTALLDVLREDLRLLGAKQSCDRKGQCGACTVILDGQAVRSCLTKAADLDGARVITIEGLGTPDNPHLLQEAFVLAGAVQCGFCTPGMIMAAKALLDQNPNPSEVDIKKALSRNLCRCTGYRKIIAAVNLAGGFLRREITPDQVRPDLTGGLLGISMPRPTAYLRACGVAQFTADIPLREALHLAAVRSPHHHAVIKGIDTGPALDMPGVFGVMTAKDIRGTNRIKYLVADQQVLCDHKIRVLGDAVALVAARSREEALAAAGAVLVDYEPLVAVRTPREALADNAPLVHEGQPNLCHTQCQLKGDAEAVLRDSATVVEADFSTQLIHQAPLEPEACVAFLEEDAEEAKLVVIGRGINIHHHVMVLQEALGWENIRYEEAFSGGQFGIKLDITSEALAGAAALHFGRPVRYVPSLTESMWITSKRHPMSCRMRLGADQEGRLTGLDVDFTLENGAYTSWGKAIVLRMLQMLSGCYNIPHVKAQGRLVYTNNAWGGAARGAGPPQMNFALESAMDMLARKIGADPLKFRLANSLQPGQSTSTGQVVEEWPFPGCLEALRPHYQRALAEAAAFKDGKKRRGVGIAGGSFGIGKAGPADKSTVAVELNPDGGLTVFGSIADPGEGTDAMLTQLAAYATGIPVDKIHLITRDTDRTPDSSSASGSRVTYMSGGAMLLAIEALQKAMSEIGATTCQELVNAGKPVRYLGTKIQQTTLLDPQYGQGIPYESRVHGVQMAEVEVGMETGDLNILRMTAVVDAGTVINPLVVEGQIEGGLDMGAGMALREEYVHGETKDWVTFKFPTIRNSLESKIILLQTPRAKGPVGAVGVGEFVLLPTAAAIMNAMENATGTRVQHLPATPQKVLAALVKA